MVLANLNPRTDSVDNFLFDLGWTEPAVWLGAAVCVVIVVAFLIYVSITGDGSECEDSTATGSSLPDVGSTGPKSSNLQP